MVSLDLPQSTITVEVSLIDSVPCDLSIRDDYHNLAPRFAERCTSTASGGWKIHSPHGISDILVDNGTPLDEVNAIIWSHFHFDHNGDASLFPSSTDLIVEPGSPAASLPDGQSKLIPRSNLMTGRCARCRESTSMMARKG
ncbi:metallo-beta-lactamase superfamily protein [Penicillium canescens]|nr:metallo-beta-lactamase superfamily protein [Penicillium canescens]